MDAQPEYIIRINYVASDFIQNPKFEWVYYWKIPVVDDNVTSSRLITCLSKKQAILWHKPGASYS